MMLGTIPTMSDKTFGPRVVAAIKARGWSMKEASRQSGVSYDIIRELHRRPASTTGAENAEKLRRTLDLDAERRDTGGARSIEEADDFAGAPIALVPVYDVEASAGPGLVPPDHEAIAYRLELPADYLTGLTSTHPAELQVIRVKGISMLPTLKPGDLIMVDPRKRSLAYDGLFVVGIDGAVLVKRIGRASRAGYVQVISDNEDQPSFERAIVEIEVIGKVIWAGVAQ